MATVLAEDDGLDLFGGKLPVLIGDAHVGAAMGVIWLFAARKGDADARLAIDHDGGDVRIDFRFDVRGDGLGDFPQGGFGYVHSSRFPVVFDSEPEFATAMFVENCGHGIETFAEFSEAFLEFDGFGFAHGQG